MKLAVLDKPVIRDDLVEELEGLLEAAKAGELQGLAYVAEHRAEYFSHHWCGRLLMERALGELRLLEEWIVRNAWIRRHPE